jgi:hypothetical protein
MRWNQAPNKIASLLCEQFDTILHWLWSCRLSSMPNFNCDAVMVSRNCTTKHDSVTRLVLLLAAACRLLQQCCCHNGKRFQQVSQLAMLPVIRKHILDQVFWPLSISLHVQMDVLDMSSSIAIHTCT